MGDDKEKKMLNVDNYYVVGRDEFVDAIVDKAPDAFPDREARKAFFDRLGVENMKDNDRLVHYSDATQSLLFRGTIDGKGNVVLNESLDLTGKDNGKTPFLTETVVKTIIDKDLKFKPMKQPIVTPLQQTGESKQQLKAEITLFALADRATSDTQLTSASNAKLPHKVADAKQVQI